MAVTNDFVLNKLRTQFGNSILHSEEPYGMLTVEVNPADWKKVISFIKSDTELKIDFLTDLCGIHYPDHKDKELGVVAHLHSLVHNFRIRLKAFLPSHHAHIDSLVEIYAGANWMERETFDFFGIRFTGHPDMRRILNMDSMDYHPMKKEYHLEDETREDKDDRYFGR